MFSTHFASVDCVNSDSCSEVTIQSCHVFFCAITVVFSAFQWCLFCLQLCLSTRLVWKVTAQSWELTRTPQWLKEKSLACCHPHDTLSRGLWCVLIFPLFGHVSRIWGLIGVAVDSPVYEPLVGAMDTSGPGEVLCFVGLSGDQYWTLSEHRVSNPDTDLKST